MPESLDVLKLRVLLCFLNEEQKTCTVTGLAGVLGEGKQKVSRMLMALEREGLLDRSNTRRPCLTEAGHARAAYYEERMNIVLNHLLYEGLDIDSALHDAYAWALMSSDEGMALIRSSEQRYRAKYELRRQSKFDGAELCRRLGDGEYRFPFLIYREYVSGGTNLSMANEAFSHPCTLTVANGVGVVRLHPVDLSACSQMTGREMNGRVRRLMYLDLVSRAHAAFSQHWLRRGADPARQRLLAYAVLRRHKAHAGIYRHLHYPDLRAAPVRGEVFVTPAL